MTDEYAEWIKRVYVQCCKVRGIEQNTERFRAIRDAVMQRPLTPDERAAAAQYMIYATWTEAKRRAGIEPSDFFRSTTEYTLLEMRQIARRNYEQGRNDAIAAQPKPNNAEATRSGITAELQRLFNKTTSQAQIIEEQKLEIALQKKRIVELLTNPVRYSRARENYLQENDTTV